MSDPVWEKEELNGKVFIYASYRPDALGSIPTTAMMIIKMQLMLCYFLMAREDTSLFLEGYHILKYTRIIQLKMNVFSPCSKLPVL